MTKNEDISNPFDVIERKTLAVQTIVDKIKYLTILFFSQHYTHLDTVQNFTHIYIIIASKSGREIEPLF